MSRDSSLDWIAGVLITVTIFLHIDEWTGAEWGFWNKVGSVFGFIMPWFFFKSGMFYKETGFKTNDSRIWRSLGVPFLTFSLFSWFVWLITAIYQHGIDGLLFIIKYSIANIANYGLLPGNGALYFIASLWLCRYLYPRLHKRIRNNYIIAIAAYAVAFAFKCFDTMIIHRCLVLVVPTAFMGLAYYAIGVQWRDMQYRMPFFIIAVVIYAIAIIFKAREVSFYVAGINDSFAIWATYPIVALASIVAWNNLARYIPDRLLRIVDLGYIGRNSMSYYCIHLIIINLDFFLFKYFGCTLFGLPLIWSYVVSCVVILPVADILLRRYLPWAVGVKGRVRKGVEVGAATDPLP